MGTADADNHADISSVRRQRPASLEADLFIAKIPPFLAEPPAALAQGGEASRKASGFLQAAFLLAESDKEERKVSQEVKCRMRKAVRCVKWEKEKPQIGE